MKRFQSIFILCFFCYGWSVGQSMPFNFVTCIEASAEILKSDALGNIYAVHKTAMSKYDNKGKLLFTYSDLSEGNITDIDVSDPMKILIYHGDFGKIKWMDNKGNITLTPVFINQLGYSNSSLIANSYENGFWLFDPLSIQVVRYDRNLLLSQQSGNISELSGSAVNPADLIENSNWLYLIDTTVGIFVLDKYATYVKLIPISNLKHYYFTETTLYYMDRDTLCSLNLITYETAYQKLPNELKHYQTAAISRQQVSLHINSKICIYTLMGLFEK